MFTARATEVSGLGSGPGTSNTVTFEVNTEPPVVKLAQPTTPSNKTTPSFSGTASENTEVVVHVFEGANEVATANTTASSGKWSTSTLSKALPLGKHTFTAQATEVSGLGNGEGESNTVTFEVNTSPPVVALINGPPNPSNETTPSFSGTASEDTEVVVHVFEGSTERAKATTIASGGAWSTGTLSPALPEGKHTFTAYATEKSGLGNLEGKSNTVTFEVNTEAPSVTIVGPPTPSKNTTPGFSGTASENTEVVVHVFEGTTEVAQAKTTAAGGKWSTSTLSKPLTTGKYTARATEVSGLGNPDGKSNVVTFEVNTESPTVTLVGPKSPSNDTTPGFSGTASENTEVVVHVFEGTTEVAQAKTTASGGTWSTSTLSAALPSGKHTFTAHATEVSGLGNGEGESNTVTFEVNTEPPTVTLLTGPPSVSNETMPSFSGAASENTEVVLHVFEGSTEVAKAKTTASGGAWSTESLSKALPIGRHTFTAYATEKSGLGNGEGKSNIMTFEVDTEPPSVTITQPATPSSNTTPSFSGTASEATEVVVHVFEGATEVASAKTTASGGTWSTSPLSKALASGKRTFTARATEVSGLGNKAGESGTVSFEVNTNAPTVTINQPPTPSKNPSPSFSGTASENTEVVVHVFEGSTEVDSGSTTASGGAWSATLSKPLTAGKRSLTAKATEKSAVGNKDGESATVSFELNTEPPVVTLIGPPTPSKNTTPSFSGTASESTEVVVHVFEGATEKASVKATASGGKWSTSPLGTALPAGKHTFTAHATEVSGLGNTAGESNTVTFEVNTEPPVVTLVAPPTPSKNQTPSFSGEASENTEVVVHVFEGSTEVATAKTTASGGKWSTSLSKPLQSGKRTFTAHATEVSGLGNVAGESGTVSFEVNTEPPVVSLGQPATPSKNQTPSFSGEASENTEVVVHVFEGATEVASASTTASGGKWSTSLSKPLQSGKHGFTAHATEVSGLGNGEGTSSTVSFEVNTEPPVVTLAQPPTPSNKTTPPFSGTASENTEVVVHVFEGTTEVAQAKTTASGGKWSTSTLSAALPLGKHTFTAFATEKSGLGNAEGKSATVSFEVNTEPPEVTLEPLAGVSHETMPAFSGTASESSPVTVEVFAGSKAEGKPVATAVATNISGGRWSTAHLTTALEGQYAARASQPSSLGNPTGYSSPATFIVNTKAPTVKMNAPLSPSNNLSPSFSGTVSEAHGEARGEVTVRVHEGSTREGKIVGEVKALISGGAWKSAPVTPSLPNLTPGKHNFTAVATAPSSIKENPTGESAPATFVLDTAPPTVTLAQPAPLSNDATPSFSGTASETTPVVVSIYRGATAAGAAVATATTAGTGGSWATEAKALSQHLEDGQYTAVATQESGIGNGPGRSMPASFTIDTQPPTVTLNGVPSPSSDRVPSFSGTASESMPVTVEVFKGAKAEGKPVTSMTAAVAGGEWYSGAVETLEWGEYTAVATEPSAIGNKSGTSSPVRFVVEQIAPVVVTEAPASVTETSAALYASVNPAGGPVSACNFEVSSTAYAYQRTVGCGFVSGGTAFPRAAAGFVPVFIRIYGLRPGTTYQYRTVAVGEGGTGMGPYETFTTESSAGEPQHPAGPPAARGSGNTAAGGVAALFAEQLVPGGKAARIGALLKNGFFKQRFKVTEAGTAVIKWYYLPPGAKLAGFKHAKKAAPSPVLVASGSVTFRAAETATLKLRLTGQGRRLLRGSRRVRLTATCAFAPLGGTAITTSGTFQLSR